MLRPASWRVAGGTIVALLALLALLGPLRYSQAAARSAATPEAAPADKSAESAAPSPAPAAQLPPSPAPLAAPLTAAQVIDVLDQTVNWYRTLGIQQQAATAPSDMLILYDNRQTANRVIGLAFDIARADADILGKQPAAAQDSNDASVSSQALLQLQRKLDAQNVAVQTELDGERRQLATAAKKSKVQIQAKISELQGELDLLSTKKAVVATMTGFATGNGAGGANSSSNALKSQIDAMAVTIPSANAVGAAAGGGATTTAAAAPATATAALPGTNSSSDSAPTRFGLWDLASNAFKLSEKIGTIDAIDQRTAALQATLAQIRGPLIDQLKTLSARGDALAAQADTADSATLNGVHDQLSALASQFKESSALLIPLSKEGVLLNQYRRNLANWREAIQGQYHDALKRLGIRVIVLAVILAILFGAAEVWRRAVLRYVHDTRRRYQLMLVRRIALWSVVVVVVGMAFASELGSIVTFAGLITAGIAVAMQSVLVSIVGYFFLIGKYGIRVGDRVQIGDVAGEVIDLGLVRMYLMELGAKGTMGPTGRVVAFANSVVFQVSSGLFKQIPGVNFSWRDVTLNLPAGADYTAIKERLLAALNEALKDYRPEILRQTQEIQRTTLSTSAGDARPEVQLRFSAAGVEAHVRYPVHLQHAAEIDERVSEALAKIISGANTAAASAAQAAAAAPTASAAPAAAAQAAR
jgi:small-conductance mechanosensitive channel